MVECVKCLDPTALGLFLVAAVSLPLAIANLLNDGQGVNNLFFVIGGLLIILVGLYAFKADSNFGFTVFVLVGFAVFFTGVTAYGSQAATDANGWENITLGIVFILAIIWSLVAKTPKVLSLILVTTALIFLVVGLSILSPNDSWPTILGVVALFNFLFNIYLAFALALENKLPIV
jgi:succinate-acetate transporter protein